ncbi:MAG: carboxypeptidase regulatory-like domain-containing protein [Acidobacteriota bacterium]
MTRTLLTLSLLTVWVSALAAQTATAILSGTVTDPSGSAVVAAKVLIRSVATGIDRNTATNVEGRYYVPALPPGNYDIRIEQSGFKAALQRGITLQVQQTAVVNVQLELGDVSQQVQVDAAPPLVATENPTLGTVVNNKLIVDLPLNGRNFLQLATLSAGVSDGKGYGAQQPGVRGASTSISVNGLRPEFNNYLLDGVTNVDGNWNIIAISPSVDTLQEFKVQTNSYSAEFGRSVGGQVNAVTKSGTNQVHGTAYEFLRNDKLDARNFFAPRRPAYRQNQFGAGAGGPVYIPKIYDGRNRTFWFYNYEGLRIRQGQTAVSTVPLDDYRTGDFSQLGRSIFDPASLAPNPAGAGFIRTPFPGGRIPANRITPQGRGLIALWPTATAQTRINNFVDTRSDATDSDQHTMRGDHSFSSKDTLFVRYIHTDQPTTFPGTMPIAAGQTRVTPQNGAIGYTRVFGPTFLNEFKFGFSRLASQRFSRSVIDNEDVMGALGIRGFATQPREFGVATLQMTSVSNVPNVDPFQQANNTFQLLDNVTLIKGKHSLKFGGEFRRFQFNIFALRLKGALYWDGRYTGNPQVANSVGSDVADLLLGSIIRADRTIGNVQSYFRRSSYAGYFQDDWRLHRRLTLNLGVRYELASPFLEKNDNLISAIVGNDVTLVRMGTGDPYAGFANIRLDPGIPYVRDGRFGRYPTKWDRNNWAPRLGLAWNADGRGRTSLRVGFGAFFSEDFANPLNDMTSNPPQGVRQAPVADPLRPDLPITDPFGEGSSSITVVTQPRIFSLARDLVMPYVFQYSATLQRQVGNDTVVEIGYSGNQGHKISAFQVLNIAPPGPGPAQPRRLPSPLVGTVTPMAPLVNSNYHGLQARAEKRFSRGYSLIAAYTWSKAIDDGTSRANPGSGDFAQDERRRDLERGLSDYHIAHSFRLGWTATIPTPSMNRFANLALKNWQLGGFFSWLNAIPFSPRSIGDANTGVGGLRAQYVSGEVNLPSDERSLSRWFNTAAFRRPDPFSFGNAGRNILKGPGRVNLDVSILKDFPTFEGQSLQFRAEFFNVPNHTNFGQPGNSVGNVNFGVISSAAPARIIQFGLKYNF